MRELKWNVCCLLGARNTFSIHSARKTYFLLGGWVFGIFFNCPIVVLHAKSNRCLLKTTAIILRVLS